MLWVKGNSFAVLWSTAFLQSYTQTSGAEGSRSLYMWQLCVKLQMQILDHGTHYTKPLCRSVFNTEKSNLRRFAIFSSTYLLRKPWTHLQITEIIKNYYEYDENCKVYSVPDTSLPLSQFILKPHLKKYKEKLLTAFELYLYSLNIEPCWNCED